MPLLLAIDGRAGGGKTTLAATINQAVSGSAVVHTDDIPTSDNWNGTDAYTPAPPATGPLPRSYFDWTERLLKNVLEPVRAGRAVRYRPPAWDDWAREGAIEVPSGCPMVIVEGVGTARLELMHLIDVVVWVQSDVEQTETRAMVRDGGGAEAVAGWAAWKAEELPFLAAQKPWERADFVVSGTPALEYDAASQLVVATIHS